MTHYSKEISCFTTEEYLIKEVAIPVFRNVGNAATFNIFFRFHSIFPEKSLNAHFDSLSFYFERTRAT